VDVERKAEMKSYGEIRCHALVSFTLINDVHAEIYS